MRWGLGWALLLTGCFSSEDFSACTAVGQPCGERLVCVAPGRCEAPVEDAGVEIDRAMVEVDAGERQPAEIIDEIPEQFDAEGRDVIILTGRLAGTSVQILRAKTIVVMASIQADGLGRPGGGGGGGGAAGTKGEAPAPGQGGASTAGAGELAVGTEGGNGGQGAPGSPPGNARGGQGGDLADRSGRPGDEAVFGRACNQVSRDRPWPGDGGGGGGGGKGAAAVAEACTGGGGGGGGAGGRGGGAVILVATERIVVKGVISARGLPAAADGGDPGGAPCAMCGQCGDEGRGGDGSAEGGPGVGGEQLAGNGGLGGAGSGGMVLLQAPIIEFERNTAIDVTGGGSAESGGLIALLGEVQGSPLLDGYRSDLLCMGEP